MGKAAELTRLIESRLRLGNYVRDGVPSEDSLATDAGVSRMTARKVLLELEQKGLVTRSTTGRRAFAKQVVETAPTQVVVLRQSWIDRASAYALKELRTAAQAVGIQLRTSEFVHWDDPIITQTLAEAERNSESPGDGVCGVLIAPPAEPMPDALRDRLSRGSVRVVMETFDFSQHGIVSLQFVKPKSETLVLDHLAQLGPGAIDCFNTQPEQSPTRANIEQWESWCHTNGREGLLFSRPVASYGDPRVQAREVGGEYFDRRADGLPRAIFCVTEAAAIGLVRCAADRGIVIGKDVALAAYRDGGHAELSVPSLTCIRRSPRQPMYERCLRWMAGGGDWVGPKLLTPDVCDLFVGESTAGPSRVGLAYSS